MSISNGKRSVVLSVALRAALNPLCGVIATATGKVWDAARDAYQLAKADFPEPQDAAKAVSIVLAEDFKVKGGTARSYISQLVKLDGMGADLDGLTMGQATAILYPAKAPAPKATDPGYVAYHEAKAKAAADKAAAEEAEAAKDPRRAIMRTIAADLSRLDETGLSIIAAEISRLVGELTDAAPVADAEAEAVAA